MRQTNLLNLLGGGTSLSAPIGLAANGIDETTIKLNWVIPLGIQDGYKVYRSDDNVMFTEIADIADPDANSYSDSDVALVIGTTYYYKMTSYEGVNESPETTVVSAELADLTPPDSPTTLAAIIDVNGDPELTWTNAVASDVVKLEIQRKPEGGFYDTTFTLENETLETYTDVTTTYGTLYYYHIRAVDDFDNVSPWSNEVSVVAQDTTAPSTPTNPAVVSEETRANVSWTKSPESDVAAYRIYQSLNDVMFSLAREVTDFWSSAYVKDLTDGLTYYFQVSAVDNEGNESAKSASVSTLITNTAPPAPAITTKYLVPTGTYEDHPTFNWSMAEIPDLDFFNVYRSADGVFYAVIATAPGPGALSGFYMDFDTKIVAQTVYYKVTAVDTNGLESADSNVAEFGPATPPEAPSNFKVKFTSNNSTEWTWDAPTDISNVGGYHTYRSETHDGVYVLDHTTNDPNITSRLQVGGGGGQEYFYKIASFHDLDSTVESAMVGPEPHPDDTTPPEVPTGLTVDVAAWDPSQNDNYEQTFDWDEVADAAGDLQGYYVLSSNDGGLTWQGSGGTPIAAPPTTQITSDPYDWTTGIKRPWEKLYAVVSVDNYLQQSANSNTVKPQDDDLSLPAAPTSPTSSEDSPGVVTVGWTYVPDGMIDYYEIHRSTDDVIFALVGDTSGDVNNFGTQSFDDDTVAGATQYYYQIRAVHLGGGFGPFSPSTTITTA